jgi:hypothetical protein
MVLIFAQILAQDSAHAWKAERRTFRRSSGQSKHSMVVSLANSVCLRPIAVSVPEVREVGGIQAQLVYVSGVRASTFIGGRTEISHTDATEMA